MHLFEEPRIRDIAGAIQARQQGDVLPINQQVLLLNQKQARHLFMFPPIIGYGFGFQPLAALLVDYSCYAFHFIEDEDRVAQYVNTILTIQQKGPYVLAGYSAGGNLAFAVAQCLERLGHRVSDLIILDTFRGGPGYSLVADVGNARLVESLTIAVDRLEIPFLKAEVIRKVQVYTHYIENVVNDGVVAANIHYIRCLDWQERLAHILQSAVKPLSPALLSWEKSTTTNFLLWDGAGNHRDVLTPGFLETNATIINTILKRIQEHKHDV